MHLFIMFSLVSTELNVCANNAVLYTSLGNIQQDRQTQRYVFNLENQLIRDQLSTKSSIAYAYYANGLQAEEIMPGQQPLHHFYAAGARLINSTQGANKSTYLVSNETELRSIEGIHAVTQLYIDNRHQSVIGWMGKSTFTSGQYNVYGQIILSADQQVTQVLLANPLRYSHYFYDMLSGLYYLKARYYTPFYRTFLSRDSADLNNRYWYGNDMPLIGCDPNGHEFDSFDDVSEDPAWDWQKITQSLSEIPDADFEQYLRQTGTFLGAGKYGSAYRLTMHNQDFVLKINADPSEDKHVRRHARVLNKANAIPDFSQPFAKNGRQYLLTQFILGDGLEKASIFSGGAFDRFMQIMKDGSNKYMLLDYGAPGNVLVTSDGGLYMVDPDQLVQRPRNNVAEDEEPVSPYSRKLEAAFRPQLIRRMYDDDQLGFYHNFYQHMGETWIEAKKAQIEKEVMSYTAPSSNNILQSNVADDPIHNIDVNDIFEEDPNATM